MESEIAKLAAYWRWIFKSIQSELHIGRPLTSTSNFSLFPLGPHPKFFAHLWIKETLANTGHLAIYPTLSNLTKIITLNANAKKTVTLNTLFGLI